MADWLLMIANNSVAPGHFTDPAYKVMRGDLPPDRWGQLDQVPLLRRQAEMCRLIMKTRAEHAPESFVWTARDGAREVTYLFMEFELG